MKHTLLFSASLALAALSASAATIVDTWSTDGGAWSPERQPQFAQTGVLNPDKGSAGGGKLINPDKQGIFESVFYTFFTAPTLTVSTDKVADNLKTVTLDMVISTLPEEGPKLKFNAEHLGLAPASVTEGEATEINGHPAKRRTFVWNVATFGKSEEISIEFTLGNHVAFKELKLIQETAD